MPLIINNHEISEKSPPYIIAELSANHDGSFDRAINSIKAAKEAGANAVKIQTYTADTMTIKSNKKDFMIEGGLWDGYQLYQLYEEAHTPYEWHKDLFSYAKEIGITLFSTPFDETAIDLLESLETPAYKIASFELTDLPLIKLVAQTKKPLLMSTGMASEKEIGEAVKTAKMNGCESILLFHCVSSYPATTEHSNLKYIKHLKSKYKLEVGLSDHTISNSASISAIALGASAIEKHFTLDKNKGLDKEFSLDKDELRLLVKSTNSSWQSLGNGKNERTTLEIQNKKFRRSIYFIKDLKAGSKITSNDIKRIRPSFGLAPKFFDEIIGYVLVKNVEAGDPVTWESIKKISNKI
tara:strand:- start:11163 stop:12221 length:1059 start_codon:yes stop_codon:yes gene_type:complete